mgnify:FL=1
MADSKQSERLNDTLFRMKLKLDSSYFKNFLIKHEFMFLNSLKIYSENYPEAEKNGIKATQISNYLGIPRPAVSKMLNGLEAKGMIERLHSLEDRRVVYIRISEKGRLFLEQAENYFKNVSSLIASELGNEKTEEFIKLLEVTINIIEKYTAGLCK